MIRETKTHRDMRDRAQRTAEWRERARRLLTQASLFQSEAALFSDADDSIEMDANNLANDPRAIDCTPAEQAAALQLYQLAMDLKTTIDMAAEILKGKQ